MLPPLTLLSWVPLANSCSCCSSMLNVRILRERGGVRKSRRSREPVGGECSTKLTGNFMNYVPVTTSKDIRLGRGGGGGGGGASMTTSIRY